MTASHITTSLISRQCQKRRLFVQPFPLTFIYLFIFYLHAARLKARTLAKFVLFKDGDSGFPFIPQERSYVIFFNLS